MTPQELASVLAKKLPDCAPEQRLSLVALYEGCAENDAEAFLVALRQELGEDLRELLDEAVLAAAHQARHITGETLEQGRCVACGARHCCDFDGPSEEPFLDGGQYPGRRLSAARVFAARVIRGGHKFVMLALLQHATSAGKAAVRINTLADETSLDRRTVLFALTALETAGWLHRRGTRDAGTSEEARAYELRVPKPQVPGAGTPDDDLAFALDDDELPGNADRGDQ